VVVITETDGMDEPGRSSREADKVSQLIARTRAYGERARIYMECTVSTEYGRTWREYTSGTKSRIVLACPHCSAWVSPERDHLAGWQEASSLAEARRTSQFFCEHCGQVWSDQDRTSANLDCRLLHEGQSIDDEGTVTGSAPETDTLGFRWSAVNNLFLSSGEIGADQWRASRSPDEENAEREMCQFVWCIPVAPSSWKETELESHELAARTVDIPRGVVPESATVLTAAVDLGKYLDHWIVVAWSPGPKAHVVDYGRTEVATDSFGVEKGTMVALREIREMMKAGWPKGNASGEKMVPRAVWVDAGYMTEVVYSFCRESGRPFFPAVGRGAAQRQQNYSKPTQHGSVTRHIGEGFHINFIPANGVLLCEVDADHWKTWVHQRLSTPLDAPGAMSLFGAPPQEHLALAKHLTAEVKTEEFIAGKGVVTRWERKRKQNHWFDSLYTACAAGYWCGVRLVTEETRPAPPPKPRTTPQFRRSDGRPWIDIERWKQTQERLFGRR
jgi:phage terminase large subunit GpA-like protein